jgi:hypothetical protein
VIQGVAMSIPTQMSLVGFIASAPELHFTKAGAECCRMRVGIEQWRKEVDGSFTGVPRARNPIVGGAEGRVRAPSCHHPTERTEAATPMSAPYCRPVRRLTSAHLKGLDMLS